MRIATSDPSTLSTVLLSRFKSERHLVNVLTTAAAATTKKSSPHRRQVKTLMARLKRSAHPKDKRFVQKLEEVFHHPPSAANTTTVDDGQQQQDYVDEYEQAQLERQRRATAFPVAVFSRETAFYTNAPGQRFQADLAEMDWVYTLINDNKSTKGHRTAGVNLQNANAHASEDVYSAVNRAAPRSVTNIKWVKRYCVVMVDVFHGRTYLYATRTKEARDMVHAFKDMFDRALRLNNNGTRDHEMSLQTDQGTEFRSPQLRQQVYDAYNVEHFSTRSNGGKAFYAEQKIRMLKQLMTRYVDDFLRGKRQQSTVVNDDDNEPQQQTASNRTRGQLQKRQQQQKRQRVKIFRWWDVLASVERQINEMPNQRYGGLNAHEMEQKEHLDVIRHFRAQRITNYAKQRMHRDVLNRRRQRRPRLAPVYVGDRVYVVKSRLTKNQQPSRFAKSSTGQRQDFSREKTYKVSSVLAKTATRPTMYKLEASGIKGRFYREELQLADRDDLYNARQLFSTLPS